MKNSIIKKIGLKCILSIIMILMVLTPFCIAIDDSSASLKNISDKTTAWIYKSDEHENGAAYKIGDVNIFKLTESSLTGLNYNEPVFCIKEHTNFVTGEQNLYTYKGEIKDSSYKTDYSVNEPQINYLVNLLDFMYLNHKDSEERKDEFLLEAFADKIAQDEANNVIPKTDLNMIKANLSDIDIEVVEQLAIWSFTDVNHIEFGQISVKNQGESQYNAISSYKQDYARILYEYLVNKAQQLNGNMSTPTITVAKNTSEFENNCYKFGPIHITSNGRKIRDIEIYDSDNKIINPNSYEIKVNGVTKNIDEVIDQDFYLYFPTETAVRDICIKAKYRESYYWYCSDMQPVTSFDNKELSLNLKITPVIFDLALRKHIVKYGDTTTGAERIPNADITNLGTTIITGTDETAKYYHIKEPVIAKVNDKIIYQIDVYNEGDITGVVTEITDYLPEGLKFVPKSQSTINTTYNWSISDNGRVATTPYLSGYQLAPFNGTTLDSKYVQIECYIDSNVANDKILTNIAEITGATAVNSSNQAITTISDRDSSPTERVPINSINTETYKGNNENDPDLSKTNYFYRGQEDDDDFEKVKVIKIYDLALRKFITQIKPNGQTTYVTNYKNQDLTKREPIVDVSALLNWDEDITKHTAKYQHEKTPVQVEVGDTVLYTIRVYNEGNVQAKVNTISDYLPVGLELKENSDINDLYEWDLKDSTTRRYETKDLNQTIAAFNEAAGEIKSIDVQMECVVTNANPTQEARYINTAEIQSDDGDDIDSTPGNVKTEGHEDDDDTEEIYVPKKDFDLALRKYISKIATKTSNYSQYTEYNAEGNRIPKITGEQVVTNTQTSAKQSTTAEKQSNKDVMSVEKGDKVTYTIRIYNEGQLAGYAAEITDYIPEGLTLASYTDGDGSINDTYKWVSGTDANGKTVLKSTYLKTNNKIIQPADYDFNKLKTAGYYEDVKVECIVNENALRDNLKNIAAITKYEYQDGTEVQDIDSDKSAINPGSYTPQNPTDGIGEQDDDDYEDLKYEVFDLALRKYISKIATKASNYSEVTNYNEEKNRVPKITGEQVVINGETNAKQITTAEKQSNKDLLSVTKGDKVTYTIRIYNEGQIAGLAAEVTDYLPQGLSLVNYTVGDGSINDTYKWVSETDVNGKTVIKSTYLKDNNKTIQAADYDFNKLKTAGYYEDLLVECIVNDSATRDNLKNIAAITKYEDSNGNEKEDVDSDKGAITPDNYNPINPMGGIGEQDDDDYEDLQFEELDLALRKFISKVADNENMTNATTYASRVPTPDNLIELCEGTVTTATYNHSKTPVQVKIGDYVEYTIRVYNEGTMDGYAREITDHLPEYLEFVDCSTNKNTYKWQTSNNGRTVTTDYLKDIKLDKIRALYGGVWEPGQEHGSGIIGADMDSTSKLSTTAEGDKELKIICKVVASIPNETNQTNIAEITKYGDKNNTPVDVDRDSQTTGNGLVILPSNIDLPNYKKAEIDSGISYIPGQQDDDDFEKIYVSIKNYDLALRKYVSKIATRASNYEEYTEYNNQENRVPRITGEQVIVNKQTNEKQTTTAEKKNTKEKLEVSKGDIVTYTIRIYNEGQVAGYAGEVTDYLPEGLSLISYTNGDNSVNDIYKWNVDTDANGNSVITTTYLKDNNIILQPANYDFTKLNDVEYYADLKVECIVNWNATKNNLKNIAAITKYEDENGNEVQDIDSGKEALNPNTYNPINPTDGIGQEDDDDFEELELKEVLDLALRKFITRVADNPNMSNAVEYASRIPDYTFDTPEKFIKGEITTANYEHDKTPVQVNIGDYIEYTFRVYNEGSMVGYAREITDHLPQYLEFVDCKENKEIYKWNISEDRRTVKTDYLKDTRLNAVKLVPWDGGGYPQGRYYNGEVIELDSTEKMTNENNSTGELKIICKVVGSIPNEINQTNIAEITKYGDKDNNPIDEDRDSQTTGDGLVVLPSDSNLPNYKSAEIDAGNSYIPGQQDDDDFEKVYVIIKNYDLALRKFITKVKPNGLDEYLVNYNNQDLSKRIPEVTDLSQLTNWDKNAEHHTATYEHDKTPIIVDFEDVILYTIRIYNEGDITAKVGKISDYLPEGLELISDSEINTKYGWTLVDATTRKYESKDLNIEIPAFNAETEELSYYDIQIECKIKKNNNMTDGTRFVNTAEIQTDNGDDIDSTPGNVVNKPGEDDDDKDVVIIHVPEEKAKPKFDLALRKFVTKVDNTDITTRIPTITYDVNGKITYVHPKDPVGTLNGQLVTYTIRVYNEGEQDGYASEITDNLPAGIEFVPSHETNKEYGWVMYDSIGNMTNDVTKAVSIKTDYLSREKSKARGKDALIHAFDPTKAISNDPNNPNPDFKELKVVFKVTENNLNKDRIIENIAQVTKMHDKDGNPAKDEDEDDLIDREYIKVNYFDLELIKYVNNVIIIEDGIVDEQISNYNGENDIPGCEIEDTKSPMPKVEINRKKLDSTTVKFVYTIRVTNTGEIPGYATEITDYIPAGLTFDQEDNKIWDKKSDNMITTNALIKTLLKPGESAEVKVTLRWINDENNFGSMKNIAEITQDYNEYNVKDIDSIPNNKVKPEDDIDDANILVTISTGSAPLYIGLALGILIITAIGIYEIRRFLK